MTTYTINLDDVDLALLPVRTHSYNNFLKKELFQFSVMREPAPEPTSDINYTCHICAIEVPAAFAREHAASIKHRANARIASVAAERMRALITALPPPAAKHNARFCANCASIIDDDHEATKEHRVAVMHDNLLWELMKAYVGDDETNKNQNQDDNKTLNSEQGKSQMIANKNDTASKNNDCDNQTNGGIVNRMEHSESKAAPQPTKVETKNKSNDNKEEGLDKIRMTNNIDQIENQKSTNSVHTTSRWIKVETEKVLENGTSQNEPTVTTDAGPSGQKTKLAKEAYEKELRKFMDTNKVFHIQEIYNRVVIKVNDDTVNVYSDHFHSFHRMYHNGKVECIVCDETFEQKNTEAHKYDLNHLSAVAKIGDDGNYVRKINETHSHCIICNQKINKINVEKHKQSHHHTQRKSNNVKTNATKTNGITAGNQTEDSRKDDTEKETVEINKHPYKEVSGQLHCVVCDCQVPRDLRNREDHLKGLRHVNNLKAK